MSKRAVIVTGAGSGIGRATAELFSKSGYPVVLVGRKKEKLEETANRLSGKCVVLPCDIRRDQEVHWMVGEACKQMGEIGVLINSAGIFSLKDFQETSDEDWEQQWEVNFMGAVRCTRHVLPHFIKQKDGVIINVSSTLGLRGIPRSTVYSASKAALQNFTQTLALEVAPQNVRVNAVCFGLIQTPIHGSTPLSGSAQPLGRVGTPEEAAYSIFHLSTPEAGFTTGAILVVDGGINL